MTLSEEVKRGGVGGGGGALIKLLPMAVRMYRSRTGVREE